MFGLFLERKIGAMQIILFYVWTISVWRAAALEGGVLVELAL